MEKVAPTPRTHSTVAHPKEVKAKAQALYALGVGPSAIAQKLTIPAQTVYQWVKRGAWTKARSVCMELHNQNDQVTVDRAFADIGTRTRSNLSTAVEKSAKVLAEQRIETIAHVEKVAPLAQSLTATARTLHGWDNEQKAGLVIVGAYQQTISDAEPYAIECDTVRATGVIFNSSPDAATPQLTEGERDGKECGTQDQAPE